jgi:cytochrome oxidase assembly protein ShyY1
LYPAREEVRGPARSLARVSPAPFAPRYWPVHLLALAAVVATILLGRWQYDVWHQHRETDAASVTRQRAAPLDEVLGPDTPYPASALAAPVVVTGDWDPTGTVYVSGRERDGRTGVWVVTPVVTSSGSAIPVVRGWVADPEDAPPAPRGRAALVGLLQPPEDSGATDDDPTDDVLPDLSVTDLLQRTDRDLYGGFVVATDRAVPDGGTPAAGTAGLAAVAPERLPGADSATSLRNILYAFQWWVFGAFAVFMWWRWLQEDVLGRPRRGAAVDAG